MSRALVGGFHAFQGADSEVLERVRQKEGYASRIMVEGAGKTNALELAILGRARNFIKSQVSFCFSKEWMLPEANMNGDQATQRVITAIWEGRVVYSASTFLDILPGTHHSQTKHNGGFLTRLLGFFQIVGKSTKFDCTT